jgi:hypothetical protein
MKRLDVVPGRRSRFMTEASGRGSIRTDLDRLLAWSGRKEMALRPPDGFVAQVIQMSEAFETAGRDESWWLSQAN